MISGAKDLEVCVGYETINKIKQGEEITFSTNGNSLVVKVVAVRRYKTFEEMLAVESYKRIAPDSASSIQVLNLLKRIYDPDKEKLGVVVLELSLVK